MQQSGNCLTNAHYAGGVNNYLNSNRAKYLPQAFGRFLAFWKISAPHLRILWRQLLTEVRNVYCFVKYIQTSNRWRKERQNRSIIGDAILHQTGKNEQKCGTEFGGLLWRHLTPEKKPEI